MNGIGKLTSVVTGTASAIIYHIRLHHAVCNTEKPALLSSLKMNGLFSMKAGDPFTIDIRKMVTTITKRNKIVGTML
jgi:hypothetical protein